VTAARAGVRARVDPWILGALVVALALRLFRLDAAPLWLDEMITARWIEQPWLETLRIVTADNHPPAYVIVLKLWATVAGHSEWALRFPSVVFSCAAVWLTAAAADTLLDRTAARWAAWMAALSPFLLQHAQEARMYALVAPLAALHLLLLVRFVTGKTPALGWGFALSAIALVGTHYYAVFFVAARSWR